MPADWNFEKIFSEASKAGFQGVEIALGSNGITMDTADSELISLKALAAQYGLEICSVACGLFFENPLTADDPDVRARGRSIAKREIDIASILGCDTVLVVPGAVSLPWNPDFAKVPYDVAYIRALDAVRYLSQYAEKKKVCIGIENVWNRFLLSPLEMRDFIDKTGSDYVGSYFDAGNVLLCGHPEQWVEILGKRIKKVHIKDFKVSVGNLSGFVPLLEGDLDFPVLMSALRSIGYDGWITAEVSCKKTPAEISACMDTIFTNFGGLL